MLTAFFLTDKFNGNIKLRSGWSAVPSQDGNYVENVSDPRPRVRWITGADTVAQSRSLPVFTVDASNRYVEISATPSGGITTYDIPYGLYSADTLCSTVTSKLQASGPFTAWSLTYTPQGKFIFSQLSSSATYFRWKTGVHGSDGDGTSLAAELGFDSSQDQSATIGVAALAAENRYDTTTMILFDKGDSAADMYAWLCDVDVSGGVDDAADGSSVKVYGNSTQLFFDVSSWVASASKTLSFSAAPTYEENPIRLATNGGIKASERYWLWVWRHQDEVRRHKVGLCKAFDRTWSGTRTIATLAGHGMKQPQRGLGIDNYYPVTQLRRWSVPLSFDSWGAADYRTVIQGVVRHGKADGLLWALRWDDIGSGAVDANDEADKGFLVWGALQEYSLDTFVGESADYMSGSLKIEQIR